jgi:hypothetical protein
MSNIRGKGARCLFAPDAAASPVSSVIRRTVRAGGGMVLLFLGAILVSVSVATPSHAITCTDRQQVCFRYCEKNYANVARCKATCAQLLSNCMSTGCWESKVTTRQCGISKQ